MVVASPKLTLDERNGLLSPDKILPLCYEEDFLGFSDGFRPGRSQHQALDALSYALVKRKVNYVLDADIQGFFDNARQSVG